MRNYLIVLALLLAGSTASAATRRHGGLSEFQPTQAPTKLTPEEARKKAAGIKDVQGFGAEKVQNEPPFPWKALGFSVALLLFCAHFGVKLYRSTQKDLSDQATFGLQKGAEGAAGGEGKAARSEKRPPSRKRGAAAQPANETRIVEIEQIEAGDARNLVWDAISSASDWVGAEWIASTANIPVAQAAEEIGALVDEGYLEEARDRAGKPVFRMAAA